MMNKSKIAKAIAMAMTGTALSAAGISTANATVTTMYNMSTGQNGQTDLSNNTTNPTAGGVWALSGNTDGWTNGAGGSGANKYAVGELPAQKWLGTATATTAAFGYSGAHLNWGMNITGGNGGTGTISTLDSFARYGAYADIDTAKGAWAATNTGPTQGGWRHDLDVGLFKSDTSGLVTLTATGLINTGAQFGFTIFEGVDNVTKYQHHGGWNANNNTTGITSASNPYNGSVLNGSTPLTDGSIIAYSVGSISGSTPSGLNTIQFYANAGQTYTIFLGGYMGGNWNSTTDGYSLTVSQVPVPAAVWLFGSALAGMGIIGRRRNKGALVA